jgi:hypothetical protein
VAAVFVTLAGAKTAVTIKFLMPHGDPIKVAGMPGGSPLQLDAAS